MSSRILATDEEAANPPEPETPAPEQVWVAFSRRDPALVKTFLDTGARPLEDGVIGGVSGALLIQALGRKVPVATLLVSAQAAEGLPDHRAGAALIETLDKLLPELKIDTGPLRKQAEQIERMLRAAMKTRPPPAEPFDRGPPRPVDVPIRDASRLALAPSAPRGSRSPAGSG